MPADASAIAANLARVRERIAASAARAGRQAEDVTLVAVSKTFPAEAIRAAWEAGVRRFGENRVQEREAKQPALAGLDATWHLVGHLQSNKARRAARLFDTVDSVDSAALAEKLDRAAAEAGRRLRVLLEVRLAPEETRHGAEPDDAPGIAEAVAALPQLDLAGLMAIPPFLDNPEAVRPHFTRLRKLRDRIAARLGRALPVLSMGMSHDFEVAIEEGATEVRLGTALFGPRA